LLFVIYLTQMPTVLKSYDLIAYCGYKYVGWVALCSRVFNVSHSWQISPFFFQTMDMRAGAITVSTELWLSLFPPFIIHSLKLHFGHCQSRSCLQSF
jgi:hypothetical protein